MRIPGITLAIVLVTFADGFSHDDEHEHRHEKTPAVRPEEAWKPTAIPDRILLSWESDPTTTQSVSWRTDETVKQAVAEIALSEEGPGFASHAKRAPATTEKLQTNLGPSLRHTVRFTDLKPKTIYAYRVGDGTNWSEWVEFQTADEKPAPFSFVYFGDAQNSVKAHWSRVIRRAYKDAPRASFFLHAGDLINRSENDAHWGEWFYAGGFIHRSTACIATPGNHEYGRPPGSKKRQLSTHWQPTFAFPQNGPEGLKESVYFIDYQGVRIVSLNSNEQHEEQAKWLDNVLSENPNRWTILTFHHPMYSTGRGRDNPHLRKLWQPVIDRRGVDLVLQGHDHTYGRTKQMTGEKNLPIGVSRQKQGPGPVYVVSVSGPKMYRLNQRPFMRRMAENTQLYQIISIDGAELKYEARTAMGRLYDAFILRKEDDERNTLIDKIPDTPERRRK